MSSKLLLLEDFILPALKKRTYGRFLEWVDPSQTTFRVVYQHKNQKTWSSDSTNVFTDWDRIKGRKSSVNYTAARLRFKAALSKSLKLEKISDPLVKHTEVFRILDPKEVMEKKLKGYISGQSKKIEFRNDETMNPIAKPDSELTASTQSTEKRSGVADSLNIPDTIPLLEDKTSKNTDNLIIPDTIPSSTVHLTIEPQFHFPVIHIDPVKTENEISAFNERINVVDGLMDVADIITILKEKSCGLFEAKSVSICQGPKDVQRPTCASTVLSPNIALPNDITSKPMRATHCMPAIPKIPQRSRVQIAPRKKPGFQFVGRSNQSERKVCLNGSHFMKESSNCIAKVSIQELNSV